MKFLLLAGLILLTSCSLIPDSVVRVAIPPGEPTQEWTQVWAALPTGNDRVSVEVVARDSFPPPDLVWFDGRFDDPEYSVQALALPPAVESLAGQKGVAAGWFAPNNERILPLAWSPWSWWSVREGASPPESEPADEKALARFEAQEAGPALGGEDTPTKGPATTRGNLVWRSWAEVNSSTTRTDLTPMAARRVVTRVKGFWWNEKGWNRNQVPKLWAQLWSPEAQAVWTKVPGWFPVTQQIGTLSKASGFLIVP